MARIDRIDLSDRQTLADLITRLTEKGITDFSAVKVRLDYQSCCSGHPDGEYCYCGSAYADPRLEWPI